MEESVGDPGHETGGETEKGGLLCTDVDAEEEGEEGTSVLVSPSTAPTVLWGLRPKESSMSSLVRERKKEERRLLYCKYIDIKSCQCEASSID